MLLDDFTIICILITVITTLPLAWKWKLGMGRSALVVVVLTLLSSEIVALLGNLIYTAAIVRVGLVWLLTLTAAFGIVALLFYRDPERSTVDRDDLIVSPADGKVIYIRESRDGILPVSTKAGRSFTLEELTKTPLQSREAVIVGIDMSFLDVHVNRAPIKGRVTIQRHFPGGFGSLRLPEMAFKNERMTTVIECGNLQVAVVQIASRLVRQIVSYVSVGREVKLGQRIGVIRLGSQVDLVVPARQDLRIMIKTGERVRAGQTVVALLERLME